MAVGMVGRKVGMMRLYDGAGRVRAVTAIELGPNRVTQLRTADRDGYEAVQLGYRGDRKRLTRPARGHLRGAGIDEVLSALREFRLAGAEAEFSLGEELRVDRFTPGEFVDVNATSKGRGFAGGVKRWNFRGGPKTHGQSDRHRAPGSIGAGTSPGRVWKGQKMAGHMGSERKTVRNLLVVLTDASRNLLFVEGSVPGPKSTIVVVTPGRRSALAGFQPPAPFAVAEELAAPPEAEEVAPQAVDETPAAALEQADAEETVQPAEPAEAETAEDSAEAGAADSDGDEARA